ncbi:diguanylate cyclase [Planctomyces sp. SH-PL62]|uniref:diguanylate cyclase n=1 Tax=Planctomyces sp. SH-PL62 TaxID=1636152 RepID=UPI00078BA89D|nr:diguanylate cyclase [Planctomyces sp. SH-PL62]AMV40413.1 putative diguanylate cyclase YdaM [Planctomyces sp. SH-PL62]
MTVHRGAGRDDVASTPRQAFGIVPGEPAVVLVVDRDPARRSRAGVVIANQLGRRVRYACGPEEATAVVRGEDVAAVLAGLQTDDGVGLELVRSLRRSRPEIPVVVIAGDEGDEKSEAEVAEALRMGATDYVARDRLEAELGPTLDRLRRLTSPVPPRGCEGLVRQESRFVVADDPEALAVAIAAVREQFEVVGGWDPADSLRMAIALEEALRAVVGPDRRAALTVVHEPDASRFTLRKDGEGAAPPPAAGPLAAEPSRRFSTRALRLMRSFMDEVRFDRDGDGVTLVKRLASRQGRPAGEATDHDSARRLIEAFPDAAYMVDATGRILYWNEAAVRFTGYSREEMIRPFATVERIAFTDSLGVPLSREKRPAACCLREGRSVELHLFFHHRDHRQLWVEVRGSLVRDNSGGVAGCLVVLRDATSSIVVEQALRQARREAESDPLTGLANRRTFDRLLDLHLRMQAREGRPFCLIMADIDHFKSINDGWGHAVGDRALTAFARMLQNQSRAEDVVVRFGGEEFVILLPDHSLDVAARIAERLRAATPSSAPPELGDRRLTASFGVAQALAGESASELIRRADAALYRAKDRGRDRVELDQVGGAGEEPGAAGRG